MEDLNPEFVFFKWPLYSPIRITEANIENFKLIMNFSQGVYHPANSVEGHNPFLGNKPTTFVGYGHPGGENFDYVTKYGGLRGTSIRCVRDGHVLTYYFYFNIENRTLTKVGQHPSIADFQIQDIKKYRAILGKDKSREFAKAIGLAANGVGIGSFVYLRRIFEDLIWEAFHEALSGGKIDDETFKRARMDERIGLLKEFLPDFLYANRELYRIMSAGIHTLSEEDCLMHFEPVKVGIELILDEKVEKLAKAAKLKEANQKIQLASQQVKAKLTLKKGSGNSDT